MLDSVNNGLKQRGKDMGMYYCFQCDNHIDNDYHPCEEHPYNVGEMVCPDCAVELEEEMRECYLEDHQE
jgi:hypothetical protein